MKKLNLFLAPVIWISAASLFILAHLEMKAAKQLANVAIEREQADLDKAKADLAKAAATDARVKDAVSKIPDGTIIVRFDLDVPFVLSPAPMVVGPPTLKATDEGFSMRLPCWFDKGKIGPHFKGHLKSVQLTPDRPADL